MNECCSSCVRGSFGGSCLSILLFKNGSYAETPWQRSPFVLLREFEIITVLFCRFVNIGGIDSHDAQLLSTHRMSAICSMYKLLNYFKWTTWIKWSWRYHWCMMFTAVFDCFYFSCFTLFNADIMKCCKGGERSFKCCSVQIAAARKNKFW